MTDKRERVSTDPGLGPLEPRGPSTLRSIEAAEELSSVSPNAPVYYEPSPLVAISDHKTLELETVKLAENIDPRKLATEMRLGRVPSLVPPSDSGWPPETALSSSTPPDGPSRRWRRAPLVLCALLGALLVLVLARVAARRPASAVGTSLTTVTAVAAPPPPASAEVPAAHARPAAIADRAIATAASAAASAEPAHADSKRATSNARQRSAKSDPPQPAAREPLAAPSSSNPKRAIY